MPHQIDITDFDSYTAAMMLARTNRKRLWMMANPRTLQIFFVVCDKERDGSLDATNSSCTTAFSFEEAIAYYNSIWLREKMQKLFMLQTALNNLVASGKAETYGMGWKIIVDECNILFIDCLDEGFEYQFLYSDEDAVETGGKHEKLESVSELKELIAEE